MRISPILLLCVAAHSAAAQTGSENVTVHVVNSLTGAPIAGANVVLAHPSAATLWGHSEAGGIFKGRASTGSHLLTVTHKGYRMISGGMGKLVEVKARSENDVTMDMLPLGVIAGRVLDQYGDPVRHAIARTEDEVKMPGEERDYESYSAAITDDRGEYRIMEVAPGKHYVAVEYSSAAIESNSRGSSRYRWPASIGLVLYPDATDLEQAQQVEVSAGATTRLNDIRLKIQRALSVSGRIKPPTEESFVSLQRAVSLALSTSGMVQGAKSVEGGFKIEVLPGKYILSAAAGKSGKISKPLTIDLREKDITGLELDLTSGYEIRGRVVVDGQESLDFSKIDIGFGMRPAKLDPDGTFQTHLFQGKGHYLIQDLPADWYVKQVQVAGKPIIGRRFELEPGSTDVIITLSPRGGRLAITLERDASGFPVAYVAILPERGEIPDIESMPHAQADESGRFIVRAIPPGSYRVFTLDASNWYLMMRPDALLEKYRKLAPLISIAEGEQKQIMIPVVRIPPE